MKKFLTCALAAVTVVGGFAGATAASARDYHGGYHGGYHGHDGRNVGAAVALGALAGVAIAGSRPYYGPSYGYYGGPAYYEPGYYRHCWIERRWDPYYGRVNVRVCR